MWGPNGSGKTSVIEAIYCAITGRSCRTSDERDLVKMGKDFFRVELVAVGEGGKNVYETSAEKGKRKVRKLNGIANGDVGVRGRPLLGVFLSDRLEVVKGPPGARRAHMDVCISAAWPARADVRRRYARALAQRNAVLARGGWGSELSAWDGELTTAAVELVGLRRRMVECLSPPYEKLCERLGLGSNSTIDYKPSADVENEDEFRMELESRYEYDRERMLTGIGPHRDDFVLNAEGKSLRKYGSQGEQRVALLALLLADRELIQDVSGSQCVLLLDDVMSELDEGHRRLLISELDGGGQSVISTADPRDVPEGGERSEYELSGAIGVEVSESGNDDMAIRAGVGQ